MCLTKWFKAVFLDKHRKDSKNNNSNHNYVLIHKLKNIFRIMNEPLLANIERKKFGNICLSKKNIRQLAHRQRLSQQIKMIIIISFIRIFTQITPT